MSDLTYFHWSPLDRRKAILRHGLRPGMRSVAPIRDIAGEWRAPYISLGTSPGWAWNLSGRLRPEVPAWDLWQVWQDDLTPGFEVLVANAVGGNAEIRVRERIRKRHLWYVATRTNPPMQEAA